MSVFIPSTAGTVHINTTLATTYTDLQNFTVTCWAYLNGTTPSAYRTFISIDPWFQLQTNNTGNAFNAGTGVTDNIGSALIPNTWYHLAETFYCSTASSRNIRGYINGQLNVNVADTGAFTSNYASITIGNWSNAYSGATYNQPVNGNLRDIRVWKRTLTGTEIVTEMNSKVVVNNEGLIAWYLFDDNLVNDSSGMGNILTTTGAGIVLQNGGGIKTYVKCRKSSLW